YADRSKISCVPYLITLIEIIENSLIQKTMGIRYKSNLRHVRTLKNKVSIMFYNLQNKYLFLYKYEEPLFSEVLLPFQSPIFSSLAAPSKKMIWLFHPAHTIYSQKE